MVYHALKIKYSKDGTQISHWRQKKEKGVLHFLNRLVGKGGLS
jgi:hypothetical protein